MSNTPFWLEQKPVKSQDIKVGNYVCVAYQLYEVTKTERFFSHNDSPIALQLKKYNSKETENDNWIELTLPYDQEIRINIGKAP